MLAGKPAYSILANIVLHSFEDCAIVKLQV